jgi:hypothetical protein
VTKGGTGGELRPSSVLVDEPRGRRGYYFRLARCGFRNRTPSPVPVSSIARIFKSSSHRSLVGKRDWDLSIDNLNPADRRDTKLS